MNLLQRGVDGGLGSARLRLRVWQLRADPTTRAWITDTRSALDRNDLGDLLDAQTDVRELVAMRRASGA